MKPDLKQRLIIGMVALLICLVLLAIAGVAGVVVGIWQAAT